MGTKVGSQTMRAGAAKTGGPAPSSQAPGQTALQRVPRPAGLPATAATVAVPASVLDFSTTAEVEILASVIEQDRAQRSLELGLAIDRPNFHVYVAGPSGTGKRSQVRALLERLAPARATPPDIVYVHNFEEPEAPLALQLPSGHASALRRDMDEALERLREELPKAFHSRPHQEAMQRVVYEGTQRRSEAFHRLHRAAGDLGFLVTAEEDGDISMAPSIDGEPIDEKDYFSLPDDQRAAFDKAREAVEPLFTDFLQENRDLEQQIRLKMEELTRDLARSIGKPLFARLRRRHRTSGVKLRSHLERVYADYVTHFGRFLPEDDQQDGDDEGGERRPDPFIGFRVKVVVDHSKRRGAPVVFENHPSFYRMFGKIERRVEQGIYFTDHTMIRAGSLLQAHGGYLVCHAADLFALPGVWENLKSSLRNREVAIEDLGESAGLLPTSGLKPEPIPIDVKIVLIGSNSLYHTLYRADDDFRKIFQIKADFDDEIRRTDDALRSYVRFIATAAHNNDCLPLTPGAVAAVIEQGSRLCESQRRLTMRFNAISNLLIEATWHARRDGGEVIDAAAIDRAVAERVLRSSLIADKMHEDVLDGQVLIEATGHRVGVINGLAVLSVGEHDFGRPFRVTARVFAGSEGVVNIEHEVDMSGELHDKGVQILVGLLGDRFARKEPLALTATVTFEQSYGAVDGDSASSTWLYGILSALADLPIDQGIGVTGSINQLGDVQPVGGINQKIEGFYRFCAATGLTGSQGVILPATNVQHLMLDAEVRSAIAAGQFHLYPVTRIEEGVEILTGVRCGQPDEGGAYPPDTALGLAAARLDALRGQAGAAPLGTARSRRGGGQAAQRARSGGRGRDDDGSDDLGEDGGDLRPGARARAILAALSPRRLVR